MASGAIVVAVLLPEVGGGEGRSLIKHQNILPLILLWIYPGAHVSPIRTKHVFRGQGLSTRQPI